MVKKGSSQSLNPGDDFYLLHICRAHNFFGRDKYYFKIRYRTHVLQMKDFFRSYPALRSALFEVAATSDTGEDIEFDIKDFCEKNNIVMENMYFE